MSRCIKCKLNFVSADHKLSYQEDELDRHSPVLYIVLKTGKYGLVCFVNKCV